MFRIFLLLIFVINSEFSSGQFNDSIHNVLGAAATGNINTTNDGTNYLFNHGIKYGLRRSDISLNSNSSWIYGESQSKKINNDYSSSLDFNLYKTFKHFFYWGLANYIKSYSLAINDQEQGGFGIAYNIFDKESFRINISTGVIYEHSNIIPSEGLKEEYETFRSSSRLHIRWKYKNLLTVNGMGFYQPSLNYGNDYIIKNTLNLSCKLFRSLNFSTDFNYNLISRTKRETLLLTYGLNIEKYF